MVVPSSGGLILYQVYGNLYAMTVTGDGISSIKRRHRDQSSDDIRIMAMASGRGRLKEDLESSMWRRHLLSFALEIRTIMENSAKRKKTIEHQTFKLGGSSFGQDYESELGSSTSGVTLCGKARKNLSPSILTKAQSSFLKLSKKSKISWTTYGNQDILYLKKGNSGLEKIVLSLHKFPIVIFLDNDIEERTFTWVYKCVKMFKPYARYGVKHWKNPHAKIFYIKNQQAPGKPKKEIYSNLKIIQIIKTYWELGHEHKFITDIVARRENESIVSVTESDYKYLNKNYIEDMYLLIVNHKVDDYAKTRLLLSISVFIWSTVIWERVHNFQLGVESYQQQVNLITLKITLPGIEKYNVFSIVSKPVYGIIYENSKKEKRVMRHQEVHKFCDATLKRVLQGLKSYNNDVKYVYVTHNLSKEDVEYLQLFAKEIKEWLKYRDQIRRWEIYVNG
uniref:Uncharacterized protein n=1 Tax=Tanacetum cinerariifolium TaxID=118510 RepID=A0A6L2LRV9_TANCI|nr:hypothetical protein [Tanacetum cinerariifolium]